MYNKQTWLDEIPDMTKPIMDPSTGKQKTDPQTGRPLFELVQVGTRITSTRLNTMESGIDAAHGLVEKLAKEMGSNFVAVIDGVMGLQCSAQGLIASWTAGVAYVSGRRYEITAGTLPLNPTQGQYLYVDVGGVVKKTSSQAAAKAGLVLFYVATDTSGVISSNDQRVNIGMDEIRQEIDANTLHSTSKDNPHEVNKDQIGLGNVDNIQQATKTEFNEHVGTGGNAHAVVTSTTAGFMSPADKNKINGIQAGAQVNAVTSVAGKTGAVSLTSKDIVGLNTDNLALATNATATGARAVGIGFNVSASAAQSVAIGDRATTTGSFSVAIGVSCEATQITSIAIGYVAKATGDSSIAIGDNARASGAGSVAIGDAAVSLNDYEGVLGASHTTKNWKVPGSLSVAGTKNFEIPHPAPHKKATHVIRHGAVESPTSGDTLYRYTVEAAIDGETVEIQLPDYFEHLNINVDVWVNGHMHFGRAFGWTEGDKLKVTCEKAGTYKTLIIGTRNDDNVQEWYFKGVEREIGESWLGETYVFEVEEIIEIEEFKEVISK
uniref:hypothetical protein n=1 Tax=Paenibacillus sp. FSL k6-2145 TaxID=2976834 RepID=UPI00403F719C